MKHPKKAGNQNAKKPNPKAVTLSFRCRADHKAAALRKAARQDITLHDLLLLPHVTGE